MPILQSWQLISSARSHRLMCPENLVLGDEANTVSYKVKSTFDIKVSSPDSWITAKYAKGVMTVSTTANNDGHLRRGKIVIESMAGKDTIKVTQVDSTVIYWGVTISDG